MADIQRPQLDRAREIVRGGVYEFKEQYAFRAGSYVGYGQWRSALCYLSLGVNPNAVWQTPNDYADKPFYELIDFSDCEGIIGTGVSVKLAHDFFINLKNISEKGPDEYFILKYSDWRKAFEMASNNGFVSFH